MIFRCSATTTLYTTYSLACRTHSPRRTIWYQTKPVILNAQCKYRSVDESRALFSGVIIVEVSKLFYILTWKVTALRRCFLWEGCSSCVCVSCIVRGLLFENVIDEIRAHCQSTALSISLTHRFIYSRYIALKRNVGIVKLALIFSSQWWLFQFVNCCWRNRRSYH